MTAPVFENVHEVEKVTKKSLRNTLKAYEGKPVRSVAQVYAVSAAKTALKLWEQRDSARATAVAQDAAAQKVLVRYGRLERLLAAAQKFQERGYESGFQEMNEAIAQVPK